jgi:molybdopterin-containing oxidoreductase family iron-sulfur binding subunit
MSDLARRDFLGAAGLGAAALAGCTRAPKEKIVPYAVQPPEVIPGVARRYATALVLDGYARGVVVESHEGRPTKVEGNPDHPASLGATSAFDQAAVLSLYDPRRAGALVRRGEVGVWRELVGALREGAWARAHGRGLWLLLPPTSSPTLAELLGRLRERSPEARLSFHAPLSRVNAWEGARLALGRPLETRLELRHADVIVSLESDCLGSGPQMIPLARAFADRRRLEHAGETMNRLYVAEAAWSLTGMAADHRLALRSREIAGLAAGLLSELGVREAWPSLAPPSLTQEQQRWVRAVARDLESHRGASAVIAGDGQPPLVHALAHAINEKLGNVGRTVTFGESPILEAGEFSHGTGSLARALEAGEVDTLLVLVDDPVYTAPADIPLGTLLARARISAYLARYDDATARACEWTIPAAHELESWGDARAFEGTATIVQPLIEPLFAGRTATEVVAALLDEAPRDAQALVRDRWRGARADEGFERLWRKALARGVVEGTQLSAVEARVRWDALPGALAGTVFGWSEGLEIVFARDDRVHDGRFARDAWLLELPSPIGKLTWGNAAILSPQTAAALGAKDGDELELQLRGRSVRAPAFVLAGQADASIALSLGWGREHGADAYRLRTAAALHADGPIVARKTGNTVELALTQLQRSLEGRDQDILVHATLAVFAGDPTLGRKKRPLSLYQLPASAHAGYRQWGMTIDLNACTGCSACVVACQAENNVPSVGKDGVLMGRVMHWLRIDTYEVEGRPIPQPMLCQHCEKAPCEYVCPVNATMHSADGLNQMVYNRCVGTRFCSNNCPYKVRRFNWFEYRAEETPLEALANNPDVTVRQRGVMEKCTFCVQRIREWEIRGEVDPGSPALPLQTACQEVCPSRAIVFGDLSDPRSEVARSRQALRSYGALEGLGTVPRVRYLARVSNPNPELT